jgi:hypothetical protein
MSDTDTLVPLPDSERTYDDDLIAEMAAADWHAFQRDLESDWRL